MPVLEEKMRQLGKRNEADGLEAFGIQHANTVLWNYNAPDLYEVALANDEAVLTADGALSVETGVHTGRSAADKYAVRDSATEDTVWWDNTSAMTPAHFELLLEDFLIATQDQTLFVQDLVGGADPVNQIRARVISEKAWHALFIRNMLIRPDRRDLESFVAEMTILNLPNFTADPARHGTRSGTVIACDLSRKIVLIGGTLYAGEMKKSVFSMLNYLLPAQDVLPMHCSANISRDPDGEGDSALFFGLSGTGKTTLSADVNRVLIGDDEHGWGPDGIFNFEGGCYAKTINLSEKDEPQIYRASRRFGAVLENVVLDQDRFPDFDDTTLTENARSAYPIDFIDNASATGRAPHPQAIVMLTADAFGVLPPIARLSPEQAMYHFLSGYTAKVAGTEKGVSEPTATFSTCFGAPFMPRHPSVYGNLLRQLISAHQSDCWLVNTGWTGGAYGVGERMPIQVTRNVLNAALDGRLSAAQYRTDPNFGFQVPVSIAGVDDAILNPRSTWADPLAYDRQAGALVQMFIENFGKFEPHVNADVVSAAPARLSAAE
jgi:phosphoenolpyruvate carboxykinase (ATP)